MASKEYFVKVSWQDPKQPLARVHDNNIMSLDLTKDVYEVTDYARKLHLSYDDVDYFTIDFMIPTGRED